MVVFFTYEEASKAYNIKVSTLYAMVSQKRIPHHRLGPRMVRFKKSELDSWIEEGTVHIELTQDFINQSQKEFQIDNNGTSALTHQDHKKDKKDDRQNSNLS